MTGLSADRTTSPPQTAWKITPSGWTSASATSGRRFDRHTATKTATATASTMRLNMRLPNSIAVLMGEWSGWATGTKLSAVHRGQVGQPRPDPVRRTAAPVTVMPALATTAASAQARRFRVVGVQTEERRRFTASMLGAVGGGPSCGPICHVTWYKPWTFSWSEPGSWALRAPIS